MLIDKDAKLIFEAYNRVHESSLYGKLSNQFQKWGIGKPGNTGEGEPGYWTRVTPREEELLDYLEQKNEENQKEMDDAEATGRQVWISKLPTTYDYLKQIGATEAQLNQAWNDIRRGERKAEPWEVSLTGSKQPTPLEYYKSYSDVNNQMADEKERRKNGYYQQYEDDDNDNETANLTYTINDDNKVTNAIKDNIDKSVMSLSNALTKIISDYLDQGSRYTPLDAYRGVESVVKDKIAEYEENKNWKDADTLKAAFADVSKPSASQPE